MTIQANSRIDLTEIIASAAFYTAGYALASQFAAPVESLVASAVATGVFYAANKVIQNPNGTLDSLNRRVFSKSPNTFGFFGNRGQSMNFPQNRKPQNPAEKIQRLDRLVAKSLTDNQVGFVSRRVIVSPRHLTIQFALSSNDEKTIKRAKGCQNTISLNTGLDRVRVYTSGRYFCVELANPTPRVVYSPELRGSGVMVPLGISSVNEPVLIDFTKPATPHLGLPGPTGTGKTQTARNIAFHLAAQNSPRDVRFVVIGQKYEDWQPLECLPHMMGFVSDPEEIVQAMNYFADITAERSKNPNQTRTPRIFIFMDDTIALLMQTEQAILPAMEYISSQGRAPGVHMIFGTQDWTNDGIGSGIVKANVKARVSFGAVSTSKAVANTGRGGTGAHKIEGMGDCLYVCDALEVPTAAAMVTDDQIRQMCTARFGGPKPNPSRPWKTEIRTAKPSATGKAKSSYEPEVEDLDEEPVEPTQDDSDSVKLSNRRPNAIERAYLRELYAKFGSERKVLKEAWGGVMNEDGRTPNTIKWLKEVLENGKNI